MKNKIISMSLKDEDLEELDSLMDIVGFSGRSETIRAGLKSLRKEYSSIRDVKGNANCILVVSYDEKKNRSISKISHEYQEIIKTKIHDHLKNHKCVEIFILEGQARKIENLTKALQNSKKTDFVTLVVN